MAKKITLQEVFRSDNWIITKISQGGYNSNAKRCRVDAKRRFRIADTEHFFSQYGSRKYLEQLSQEHKGTALSNMNAFEY